MTYKGDSPAKKLVRAHDHVQVQTLLGKERFRDGKHLVLAGHGGDAATLLALGARNIVAVDIDPVACEITHKRFPEVDVRQEDIGNAAVRDWYDAILVDFCGVIDGPKLQLLNRIGYAQTFGRNQAVVLGCAFQMGRDGRKSSLIPEPHNHLRNSDCFSLNLSREAIVRHFKECEQAAENLEEKARARETILAKARCTGILTLTEKSLSGQIIKIRGTKAELIEQCVTQTRRTAKEFRETAAYWTDPEKQIRDMDAAHFRLLVLNQGICNFGGGWHADPVWSAQYFSNTATGGGVPMLLARFLLSSNREHWGTYTGHVNVGGAKRAKALLRERAIEAGPDVFDLDYRQVAAWRAIANRRAKEAQQNDLATSPITKP